MEQQVKFQSLCAAFLLTVGLVGCGGGGESSSSTSVPVASSSTFPLQSALATLAANGWTNSFSISGVCSGSGSRTVLPANISSPYPALIALETVNWTYTNCTPTPNLVMYNRYFSNTNYQPYQPIVFSYTTNNVLGVYNAPPSIPASVQVGDTGTVGTVTFYPNLTSSTSIGNVVETYAVTADTSSTAIITLIFTTHDGSGSLASTEQEAWRITTGGGMTPVSANVQYAQNSVLWLYNN